MSTITTSSILTDVQNAINLVGKTAANNSDTASQLSGLQSSLNNALSKLSKRVLIYAAGNVDYLQFVQDYSNRGGVTALGPQVYGLDNDGNITSSLSTTYPYSDSAFVPKCKELGIDVIPLIAAGAGLGPSLDDTGIQKIIAQPSAFASPLVSLCETMCYSEVQLDWETNLPSSMMAQMTEALIKTADKMHSSGLKLSLTSYLSNYQQIYNTYQLAPVLDYLNIQDYTKNFQTFQSQIESMLNGMPQSEWNKLQVGMGDYSNVNPPIAGSCIQFLLSKGIQSLAIWPQWGQELSNANYGFTDKVSNCYNWNELCSYFLTH